MLYDLIIIGMGPGGMSAAIYAQRNGLKVLILEKGIPGGLINYSSDIDNYLGFLNTSGPDMASIFFEHIKSLNVPYKIKEVINIIDENATKKVVTKNEEFICKKVIVATGRTPKMLNLPNEEELLGKGISRCALCDGPFFKDKYVAVIGGGNSALEESLYLSKICKKVYVIHRREEFRAESILQNQISEKSNIEILYNTEVTKINEENGYLKNITLSNNQELEIDGLFVYIGFEPKINFLNNLVAIENGYIKVNEKFETSCSGIYAVGDIISKEYYQIVTAVSEGAVAAINISKELS